jgi:hypothetical protein
MGVARLRFPAVGSPTVGSIIAAAPGLSTPMVLIVQPLAAALVYLLLVSLSPHDDLGLGDEKEENELGSGASAGAEADERL